MNFEQYIGMPLDYVCEELKKLSIKFSVVESSDIQKKFDTILVVKVSKKDDYVELLTDKFLLDI